MVAFSHFGLRSDLPFTYDVRTEGKGVGWKADRLRTVTREEGVQKFLIFADGICERPLGRREAGREGRMSMETDGPRGNCTRRPDRER